MKAYTGAFTENNILLIGLLI